MANNKTAMRAKPTGAPMQYHPSPGQLVTRPTVNTMQEIYLQDPDEQHWIGLENEK